MAYNEYVLINGTTWWYSGPVTGMGHENPYSDWVHCNLGQGYWDVGKYHAYNAWYVSGIFDCRYGYQSLARSGIDEYYTYNLEILPNIH
jgi:hypothetical protein